MRYCLGRCLLLGSLLAVIINSAQASGFALLEYGAAGLGEAYAGQGVGINGATTAWGNPAAMGAIEKNSLSVNEAMILPKAAFSDSGSTQLGVPMNGGDGNQGAQNALVSGFFMVNPLPNHYRAGLSVSAPFGLETDYGTSWTGRYYAEKTQIKSLNIGPSLAIPINSATYIGVGLDLQMSQADFGRGIDFGTVCYGQLGPATCNGLALEPQHADGQVNVSGRDTALGYNLGFWHAFLNGARVGLHYRSRIRYRFSGTAVFNVPVSAQVLMAGGGFITTPASADLVMPDSLSLNLSQPIGAKLTWMGGVEYTRWSSIQSIVIQYDNPHQPATVIPMSWHNTYRLSTGFLYRQSDSWLFRSGLAWSETPVNTTQAQPGIPDGRRIWLSFGAHYAVSRSSSMDVGYTHIFVLNMSINLNEVPNGNLLGDMNLEGNVVAFQYNYTW